ncbi:MAG TPA: hypothetical protein VHI98_17595 [Vicinamibacterales bacterium]|jgi:hypothetical protein|nr:hypothetical protein [Vicinamibacterales bacterium]
MPTELLVDVFGNLRQMVRLSANEVSMALAGTALLLIGALVRRLT